MQINLGATLDKLLEGCQIISYDWKYLYVNNIVVQQGHKTKEELLGHTMMEVYPGIEKTEMFVHLRRCMEKRKPYHMDNSFTYPDGKNAWFELRMQPIPEGVFIFSIDITRAKEIDREKTEFVSIASHALRTPLGISKWYLEALKDGGYLNNVSMTIVQYLDEVYRNNERLLLVVRNLLSVSRIDQGRVVDAPQKVNILELLKKIITDMSLIAEKNTISMQLTIQEKTIPDLFIDQLKVQEIIENLISNAIKYNKADGKITIVIDKTSDRVLISVADTGIGISPKDQQKLFTKFFRTEKAISTNTEGSGLGLYVVKAYVESWGGKITLTSKEGKGSTFFLELPITMKDSLQKNQRKGGGKYEKNTRY